MQTPKALERQYSVELSKLKPGLHEFKFEVGNDFFRHFEHSQVHEGEITVTARIQKYETHLDVKFGIEGFIVLECDRCTEPYRHQIKTERRVIYSYDPKMESDHDDVIVIQTGEPWLNMTQEIYEFITLEVPIRKVPAASVHVCPPEVLALIGAAPGGEEFEDEEWEEEEDDSEDEEEEDDLMEEAEEVEEWEEEEFEEEDFEEDEEWEDEEDEEFEDDEEENLDDDEW